MAELPGALCAGGLFGIALWEGVDSFFDSLSRKRSHDPNEPVIGPSAKSP